MLQLLTSLTVNLTQLRCWGNVVGSRAVRYINVPMERLKELAIAQNANRRNCLVWFRCRPAQQPQSWNPCDDVYDFESSMDIQLTQDKAGRLTTAKV